MKVVLASSSENRRALFEKLGIAFEQMSPEFEEIITEHEPPHDQIQTFALEKAKSVFHKYSTLDDVLVMGFDSMIELDGASIGKPNTKKQALEMIQKFVGRTHEISTGVACVGNWKGKYFEEVALETTTVHFRKDVTNCQIKKFLEFGDWKGKCGAYSILGTGIFLMESYVGDFQNIIGVPVLKLGKMVREVTGKSPLFLFSKKEKALE